MWRGPSPEEGKFWTLDDPREMDDWRDELAVPPSFGNTGAYLTIGIADPDTFFAGTIGSETDDETGKRYNGGASELFFDDGATIIIIESKIPFNR